MAEQLSSTEFLPNFLGFDVHKWGRLDSYGGIFTAAKHELERRNIQKSKNIEMISGSQTSQT